MVGSQCSVLGQLGPDLAGVTCGREIVFFLLFFWTPFFFYAFVDKAMYIAPA